MWLHVVVLGWLGWSDDAHATRRERRWAMVVGMSDYHHLPPLHTPARDVRTTSQYLQMTRFTTTTTTDLTKAWLETAVEGFADELRRGVERAKKYELERTHVALFYYSGHGQQIGDEMLLYPVDAKVAAGVSLNSVIDTLGATGIDVLIVVVDACRTGPVDPGGSIGVNTSSSYKRLDMDMFFLFSTSPGAESRQSMGNSLFTKAFNSHIFDPGTSIEGVASLTSRDVYDGSGRLMVPWQYSSLKEPFYFVPGAERAPGGSGALVAPMTMALPMPPDYEEPPEPVDEEEVEGGRSPKDEPAPENGPLESEPGTTEPFVDARGRNGRTNGKWLSDLTPRQQAIVGLTVGGAGALVAGGAVLPFWWTIRNDAMRLVDTTPGYEEGTVKRTWYLAREEDRARRYLIGSSVTMGVGAAMIATGTGLLFGGTGGDRRARRFPVLGRGLGILLMTSGGVALAGGLGVMVGWWTVRIDAERRADKGPGYEEGTEARRAYLATQEQSARRYLYLGSAIAGAGVVTMVPGAVLVARARRRLLKQGMVSRIVPVVGRGYGGLSLVGRF